MNHKTMLAFLLIMLIFSSCSTTLNGTLSNQGSISFFIKTTIEPNMATLLRSLNGSASKNEPLVDAALINASLKSSAIIATLSNKGNDTIEGNLAVTKIDQFLKDGGFIIFRSGEGGKDGILRITISRQNSAQLLEAISEDLQDYLSAIMAPVATGEVLTKTEYLELVETVYGKDLAKEISKAQFKAQISAPATIKNIKGGNKNGNKADFDILLLDLLVLEKELVYELSW